MSIYIPALPSGQPASFVANHVGKHYLSGAVVQMNRLGPKAVSGVFGVKFAAHLDRKHPPYLANLEPDSSSQYPAPSQHHLQHNLAVSPQWQALLAAWDSRPAIVQPAPAMAPAVRRRSSRPRQAPQFPVAIWSRGALSSISTALPPLLNVSGYCLTPAAVASLFLQPTHPAVTRHTQRFIGLPCEGLLASPP